MKYNQKLEQFAEREIKRMLHTMIVDDDDGGYIIFGRYHIVPDNGKYQIFSLSEDLIGTFSNKRIAMSWCVADKFNQLNLAQNIKYLDIKRQILSNDIYCSQKLAERSKHENTYEIINMKLQPKIERYTLLNNELEKCVNSAKYLQLRGFSNETARTSGAQASKTNS